MAPKPKPAPQKSRASASSKTLSDKSKAPRRKLDRALALDILVAKLEATKTCDWYALSQRLAAAAKEREEEEKAKRKAEKVKVKVLSGSELHDLYHNVVLPGLKSGRAIWLDDEMEEDMVESEEEEGGASVEEGRVTQSLSAASARGPTPKKQKTEDKEDRTARQLLGREVDAIDRAVEAPFDPFPTQSFVVTDSDEETKADVKPRASDKQPGKPCRPSKLHSPSKPTETVGPTAFSKSSSGASVKSESSKKTPPQANKETTTKTTHDTKPTIVHPRPQTTSGPKHRISAEPKRQVIQSKSAPEPKRKAPLSSKPAAQPKPRKAMQTKSESNSKAADLANMMEPPPKRRKFWESRELDG